MKDSTRRKLKKLWRSPALFLLDLRLFRPVTGRMSEHTRRTVLKLMRHPLWFIRDLRVLQPVLRKMGIKKSGPVAPKTKPAAPKAVSVVRFFQTWEKSWDTQERPILVFWGPMDISMTVTKAFSGYRVMFPALGIPWPRCWYALSKLLEKNEGESLTFLMWNPIPRCDVEHFARCRHIPILRMAPGLLGDYPHTGGVFLSWFLDEEESTGGGNRAITVDSEEERQKASEAAQLASIMRLLGVTGRLCDGTEKTPVVSDRERPLIIVLGSQTGSDRPDDREIVNLAAKEHPGADILYVPGEEDRPVAESLPRMDLSWLLTRAVHAYTFDSPLGMDALVHHVPLTVMGRPFYAGYGLTDDRSPVMRVERALSLETLFARTYLYRQRYIYNEPPATACLTAILYSAYRTACARQSAPPAADSPEEEVAGWATAANWMGIFSPSCVERLFSDMGEELLHRLPISRLVDGQHWELAYLIGCYLIGRLKRVGFVPALSSRLRGVLPDQAFDALNREIRLAGIADSLCLPRVTEPVRPENPGIKNLEKALPPPSSINEADFSDAIARAREALSRRNLEECWQICAALLVSGCSDKAVFSLLTEIYWLVMDFQTGLCLYRFHIALDGRWRDPSLHLRGMELAMREDDFKTAWTAFIFYLGFSSSIPSIIPYINMLNKISYCNNLLDGCLGIFCYGKKKNKLYIAQSYLNNCYADRAIMILNYYHPSKNECSIYMQTYGRALVLEGRLKEAYAVFDKYLSLIPSAANFNFVIFSIANSTYDVKAVNRYYKLAQEKGVALNNAVKYRICAVNHRIREFFQYYASGIYEAWKKKLPDTSFISSLKGNVKHSSSVVFMGYSVGETLFFAGHLRKIYKFYSQHIYIVCDERLAPLLRRSLPEISFITTPKMYRFTPEIENINNFNELPRLDLCQIMANTVIPYWQKTQCLIWVYNLFSDMIQELSEVPKNQILVCDPLAATGWKKRLNLVGDKIRVGVCWRSALQFVDTQNYIFSLEDLRPLLDDDRIQLIDLQYTGLSDEEKAFLEERYPGKFLSFADLDLHDDLDGTAALISQLDCVISIPNSVGTLAAAVGVKTYLLSACQPGYFLTEAGSNDSFFFPHAELVYPSPGEGKRSVSIKIRDSILSRYATASMGGAS